MSDLKQMQAKNTLIAVQIALAILIFVGQLFLMTISLRAYMSGNDAILFPAGICSLLLLLPLVGLMLLNRNKST